MTSVQPAQSCWEYKLIMKVRSSSSQLVSGVDLVPRKPLLLVLLPLPLLLMMMKMEMKMVREMEAVQEEDADVDGCGATHVTEQQQ
ncbi:GM26603 [Drosophila sechellia]|uniref:GM26603 n=1 Tax=Drosophila sechellia TaxID=7238 RepID=B4HH27_DROSE|nr:GM26603 [Drosophila sechellia]